MRGRAHSDLRLATFGLRSIPPTDGSGGADTFTMELYTRLAQRGHHTTVYCRTYGRGVRRACGEYNKVHLVHLPAISRSGFDTLLHSFRATLHILLHNTADVVHVQNGGNSIWAFPLWLFGKRVIVGQDGFDWKREKWKWYARLFLRLSMYVLMHCPAVIVVDNVYTKSYLEAKYRRRVLYIPYGSDVVEPKTFEALDELGLRPREYLLFIGRFIPDKGIHHLVRAFEQVRTDKRLLIVGGSPNQDSRYEQLIRSTRDHRIIFPGFLYGAKMLQLLKMCYAYVQPSDVEGLSPIILTAMALEAPIICSNLPENTYAVGETALLFEKGNSDSLREKIEEALNCPDHLASLARAASARAREFFSWDTVADTYERLFFGPSQERDLP